MDTILKIRHWLVSCFKKETKQQPKETKPQPITTDNSAISSSNPNIAEFNVLNSKINITKPNSNLKEEVQNSNLRDDEMIVRFDYPETSGIKANAEHEGYKLIWPSMEYISTLELDGYEIVYDPKTKKKLICQDSKHAKDLILMKKKLNQ